MCVCVCVCIYVHICACVRTYVCTCVSDREKVGENSKGAFTIQPIRVFVYKEIVFIIIEISRQQQSINALRRIVGKKGNLALAGL